MLDPMMSVEHEDFTGEHTFRVIRLVNIHDRMIGDTFTHGEVREIIVFGKINVEIVPDRAGQWPPMRPNKSDE